MKKPLSLGEVRTGAPPLRRLLREGGEVDLAGMNGTECQIKAPTLW